MSFESLSSWNIPLKAVPRHLPVSYATVLRWSRAGRLACRRIGGRLYTSAEAIEAACPMEGDGAAVSALVRAGEREMAVRRVHAHVLRTTTEERGRR